MVHRNFLIRCPQIQKAQGKLCQLFHVLKYVCVFNTLRLLDDGRSLFSYKEHKKAKIVFISGMSL